LAACTSEASSKTGNESLASSITTNCPR
jgi:hypothetical protein